MASSGDREIDRTITKNLHRLSKYGVLTARPGYEITGHQLTGRRAIVATVHTKKPLAVCLAAKRSRIVSVAYRSTCAKRTRFSACARLIHLQQRLARPIAGPRMRSLNGHLNANCRAANC